MEEEENYKHDEQYTVEMEEEKTWGKGEKPNLGMEKPQTALHFSHHFHSSLSLLLSPLKL